jgi:hypothetical protein
MRRSLATVIFAVALTTVAVAGARPNPGPAVDPTLGAPRPTAAHAAPVPAPTDPTAGGKCAGDPQPDSPGSYGPTRWADEPLSGGRGNDVFTSTVGQPICAFQGDDLIKADNNAANEIFGSAGRRDRAIVDKEDIANVKGVELCKLGKKAAKWRPCAVYTAKARRLAKVSLRKDIQYPIYDAAVECRVEPGTGRRQIVFLREPWMPAIDATAVADWQTVAFAASLNQWDGTKWVFLQQNTWLWDRSFDHISPPPKGNYWRKFDTKERWFVWFYPAQPGIYRISITYHWYATPTVPEHEVTAWAGHHYGDFEGQGHQWCSFPS